MQLDTPAMGQTRRIEQWQPLDPPISFQAPGNDRGFPQPGQIRDGDEGR